MIPELGRSSGEGNGNPVFLPERSRWQRRLAGCSVWGRKELSMTEQMGNEHMADSSCCPTETNATL